MKSQIYTSLFTANKKSFILLIDPGKQSPESLKQTIKLADKAKVDIILVGGSLTSRSVDETLLLIKDNSEIPLVLFPGNLLQLSIHADGILLLSLLSGRNPEYLIGNHVLASQYLKSSGLEIIPTGYILVGNSHYSSVEYMSNTKPIPSEKTDIIVATALAGEQLGFKLIYLESGSGADGVMNQHIVSNVRENISIPLLVGGGIKTPEDIRKIYRAGANGVVAGTAIEKNQNDLLRLAGVRDEFS
jgi:putative glycerol-1-phosphate prenyltransferase